MTDDLRLFDLPTTPRPMREPILSCHDWNTNGDLLADVASVGWIRPDELVVDLTYGRGTFWTRYRPDQLVAHDLDPNLGDGVDFRSLPHADETFHVAVFDPPYINASTTTSTVQDFARRYGVLNAEDRRNSFDEVWSLISDGLDEAHRVTRRGGHVLVKSMTYTNGRTLRHVPAMVIARAETIGLDIVDEFVMRRPPGPINQLATERTRRNVSTLAVFVKRTRRPRDGTSSFARLTRGAE